MVQVPGASSEAVESETVQIVGVVDVKLTGSPELAVAVKAKVELAFCAGIAPNVMVCWVLPVPIPLNARLWVV